MKKILFLFAFFACTLLAVAQTSFLSYQAVVRDGSNKLVLETAITATVNLYNGTDLSPVYSEQHNLTSDRNGLINMLIGDGANQTGNYSNVNWQNAQIAILLTWTGGNATLAKTPFSIVPTAMFSDSTNYTKIPKVEIIAHNTHDHLVTEGAVINYINAQFPDGKYALIEGDNYFAGSNNFINVSVPSIVNPTTLEVEGDCQKAANFCDIMLLVNDLRSEIADLRNSLDDLNELVAEMQDSLDSHDIVTSFQITKSPNEVNFYACEPNQMVTFTATPGKTGGYAWKVDGVSQATTTNEITVTFTTFGHHLISVVAEGRIASTNVEVQQQTQPVVGIYSEEPEGDVTMISMANVSEMKLKDRAGTEVHTFNVASLGTPSLSSPVKLIENSRIFGTTTDVAPGTYFVSIASAEGCTVERTVTVKKSGTFCTVPSVSTGTYANGQRYEYGAGTQLDSVADYEGNIYQVAQVGNVCVIRTNLRTTHYTDGTEIPHVGSYDENNTHAYYKNEAKGYPSLYGYLYNWAAVMGSTTKRCNESIPAIDKNICPEGWKVPSIDDFALSMNALCAQFNEPTPTPAFNSGNQFEGVNTNVASLLAGGAWDTGEIEGRTVFGANNLSPRAYENAKRDVSQLNFLPSGYYLGTLQRTGKDTNIWTSTETSNRDAYYYSLDYKENGLWTAGQHYGNMKVAHRAVRCIRIL